MKENVVKDKSFAFALKVVALYKDVVRDKKEYVLSKQFLRSGTAIGAMVRESEHAQSKADFIHKLSIGLKEANEAQYWLDLMMQSGYLEPKIYQTIDTDLKELLRLHIAIIKSSKGI